MSNDRFDENQEVRAAEAALKRALQRQAAPDGFAERVMARLAQQNAKGAVREESWWKMFRLPVVRWATAAACSAALLVGVLQYRHAQELKAARERAAGEAAKQQLVLALRIAGSKLQLARAKVNQVHASQPDDHEEKE